MRKRIKNNLGFTLIELLVSIVVLAIIVVMSIPQISNLIDSNNDAKYDKYAQMIETSAKLYTDSYNEDMFGNNQSGCYDIKYDQMSEKKLLKDINLNNITCSGGSEKKTFARVYKSGNHYKYKISILCTNKDKETTIIYSDLIEEALETDCDGRTSDETGPTITVTNPPSGWTTGTNKKATITVKDSYGLLENIKIKYVWTTTPNNIPESAWISKNFGNARYEEQVSTTVSYPQGKTDKYYLVVKAETVRDANGNYYIGDNPIESGPYKLDNTAPRITGTTNSGNGAWKNSNVTITVNTSDVLSGVTKIYYSTSSSTASSIKTENKTITVSGSVGTKTFTTEMNKTVYVMAEDAAGNKSDVVSVGAIKIDKTKPTCTAVATGTKGNDNWWKSNATITLTTSDTGGSTLKGYNLTTSTTPSYNGTTKTAVQTNTEGTTWYGYVQDVAGNIGTCNTGIVKVDTTAPTCTISAEGTEGTNGWFKSNATLKIIPSDTGGSTVDSHDLTTSTTASYKGTTTAIQTNTTGTTWYGYVKDKAGNIGSCRKQVQVDTSVPNCTINVSGTKGLNSWYKSTATITLTTEDSAGGYNLTTSTTPSYNGNTKTATQSNTEGTTWYGYVKDAAGNIGTCTSGVVKVDTTAPTCTINATGITGDNDWYKSNATVTISTNDTGGSTVDSYDLTTSTSASYNGKASVTQSNTTGTTWYGYVKDKAGNTASCNKQIKVDTSSPTCTIKVSGTTGTNDWYKSKATITLTANDAAGGYNLTTSTSPSYNGSSKTATQSDTTGTTWYGYVKDTAGNIGSCNSGIVKVDTTAPAKPTLTISGSGTLTVKMSSSDSTSGINSFQYRGINSSSSFNTYSPTGTSPITITTSTPVEIRAVDNAGNVSGVAYTRHCNTSGGTLTYDNSKGWICVKDKIQVDSTCSEKYWDTCSKWVSKTCYEEVCSPCVKECTKNSWCGTTQGQWCWYCATGWNGPGYYRTDYYECDGTCCDDESYDCGYTEEYDCEKTRTYSCKKDACPSGFSWYQSGSTCYKTAD